MSYHPDYTDRVLEANEPRSNGNPSQDYKCCGRIRDERLMYRMIENQQDFQHWQRYEKGAPSESSDKCSCPNVQELLENLHNYITYRFHFDSADFDRVREMDVAWGVFINQLRNAGDTYWRQLVDLESAQVSNNSVWTRE